jgi:hypothetical protein
MFRVHQQACTFQRDRGRRRSWFGRGFERGHGFSDELKAASNLPMPEPPADPLDRFGTADASFALLCRDVGPALGGLRNMLDAHRKMKPSNT